MKFLKIPWLLYQLEVCQFEKKKIFKHNKWKWIMSVNVRFYNVAKIKGKHISMRKFQDQTQWYFGKVSFFPNALFFSDVLRCWLSIYKFCHGMALLILSFSLSDIATLFKKQFWYLFWMTQFLWFHLWLDRSIWCEQLQTTNCTWLYW